MWGITHINGKTVLQSSWSGGNGNLYLTGDHGLIACADGDRIKVFDLHARKAVLDIERHEGDLDGRFYDVGSDTLFALVDRTMNSLLVYSLGSGKLLWSKTYDPMGDINFRHSYIWFNPYPEEGKSRVEEFLDPRNGDGIGNRTKKCSNLDFEDGSFVLAFSDVIFGANKTILEMFDRTCKPLWKTTIDGFLYNKYLFYVNGADMFGIIADKTCFIDVKTGAVKYAIGKGLFVDCEKTRFGIEHIIFGRYLMIFYYSGDTATENNCDFLLYDLVNGKIAWIMDNLKTSLKPYY